MNSYIIYRIYGNDGMIYVGKTTQPLNRRLHGHFFSKPMIRKLDPRDVTHIEYAACKTNAA
jgi:predicted GIY-YIG superfamily endonuclease